MRLRPEIVATAQALGERAADLVLSAAATAAAEDRSFVLGCPGGRSPRSTLAALAARAPAARCDLRSWVIVMMDEYLDERADGSLAAVPVTAGHSCRGFAEREILSVLNASCVPGQRLSPAQVHLPSAADPAAYESLLDELGGVDVFLLASGASDGHIAFNGPGSNLADRTRVVPLSEQTRRDNLVTFPSFGGQLDKVPAHGVTVGPATIVSASRSVVMLLHGADKGLAARRIVGADAYDPCWPATVVAECANPHILIDEAAWAAGKDLTWPL